MPARAHLRLQKVRDGARACAVRAVAAGHLAATGGLQERTIVRTKERAWPYQIAARSGGLRAAKAGSPSRRAGGPERLDRLDRHAAPSSRGKSWALPAWHP